MTDSRNSQLASILLNYSVKLQPSEKIWIRCMGIPALSLAKEVYKQALLRGSHPYIDITDDTIHPFFVDQASPEQVAAEPHVEEYLVHWADKIVTLVGEQNTRLFSNCDPTKLVARQKAKQTLRASMMKKPWVLTYVPSQSLAQEAGMSYEEFSDFYFGATLRDWEAECGRMKKLASRLSNAKKIHIIGEQTDLTMSAQGRVFIPDCGECNMPGGEVFTAPVETSVTGYVYFNFPLLRTGKYIRDIRLWFENGKIVKATASENEDFLQTIIATDAGSSYLGEFAIGMNPGITKYVNNMLFDEKIEGTIHMAIGQAYEECHGVNTSAIHMDIVKDMKVPGSKIIVDGVTILNDGKLIA